MDLFSYDPLVYVGTSIYILGAINHYIMMKAIYIILEQPYRSVNIRLKAAIWPWEVVTTLWLTSKDDYEEDE
tara:strand:- start:567 stop:782 length:216 start_codon:yes stop_codon:yes gene_type:complete